MWNNRKVSLLPLCLLITHLHEPRSCPHHHNIFQPASFQLGSCRDSFPFLLSRTVGPLCCAQKRHFIFHFSSWHVLGGPHLCDVEPCLIPRDACVGLHQPCRVLAWMLVRSKMPTSSSLGNDAVNNVIIQNDKYLLSHHAASYSWERVKGGLSLLPIATDII